MTAIIFMNSNLHLSPEQWNEYRRRRLAIQRQAVRRVKYTLLAVAMLAGCWFLFLLWKDAKQSQYEPARIETISPVQTESPLPGASQPSSLPPAVSTPKGIPNRDNDHTELLPNNAVPTPAAPDSKPKKPPGHVKNGTASTSTPDDHSSPQ